MQNRDITGQPSGKIWHRKPTISSANGVFVNVTNSGEGVKTGRRHRFLHATFQRKKARILVADHFGGVYLFDLENNRFSVIQNCGQSCTAIACGSKRHDEYLVGLADSSVKCFSTESKELVSWMKGHESAVHSISLHSDGLLAITTSRDTAQLWNLDTFERIRKLNVKTEVPIQLVFFLPTNDTIVTCFSDDTIFGWESSSFDWKFKLEPNKQPRIGYRAFAVTGDGKTLVCGGKSNLLHVFSLETHEITQVIRLSDEVTSVKQLDFLGERFGDKKTLGVLGQDGVAYYVDIDTCQVMCELRAPSRGDKLTAICSSRDAGSAYVVGVTDAGAMTVFAIHALLENFDQDPAPLVKVVKQHWKKKALERRAAANRVIASRSQQQVAERRVPTKCDKAVSTGRISVRKFNDASTETTAVSSSGQLNATRLKNILNGFGEYPERHRFYIWRSVLQLPENQAAFDSLQRKGTHLAYAAIEDRFPVKSGRLLRVMQRVLSAMAHWSTIFSEVDYLPLVVFPFVKLFQNNSLICFETIATLITNWFQHWFEFFPNPPVNALSMVENILAHHDKELLRHFVQYEITTQIYAWPLMQTIFSEVLGRGEWLRLFDHIFSNHPGFFYHCVVAYSMCCRSALLRTTELNDFKYFYHHRNPLDIAAVIREAYRLSSCTPAPHDPQRSLDAFQPLPRGETYPIFNKYPKFIVDYQAKERERIRQDELDYLKERHVAQELADKMLERKLHEETWYQKKAMLDDAENERRRLLVEEERKLADQRKQLAAMKRELRTRELHLLDKSRIRFVDHQQAARKIELNRLEDEIKRKAFLRDEECSAAVDDVEVRGLELEVQRSAMEQQMAREQAELEAELRAEVDRRRKLEQVEAKMAEQIRDKKAAVDLEQMKDMEQEVANAELRKDACQHRTDVVARLVCSDIDREKSLARALSRSIGNLKQQKAAGEKLQLLKDEKHAELLQSRDRLRFLEMMRGEGDERRARMLHDVDLDECRKRVRDSEKRLQDQLERMELRRMHRHAEMEENAERRLEIEEELEAASRPTGDGDRTTAVHNEKCLNEILEAAATADETSVWSHDPDRMRVADNERKLLEEVRELRQRMVSQRRPPF